ncbi:hypothetical protein V501_00195 [Pseudogymnoascus sp. VKM F-4519 (FW-2642)]|nr:hypothetical protein V501_00195 [Pseudogymnoascus sp. VKM F-4519 (FW-2642)]
MKLFISLELLCQMAFALATTGSHNNEFAIHEKRVPHAELWTRSSTLDLDLILPLKIALTQSNLDKAEDLLLSVSHPASTNFSQHWTPKDVARMFAPSLEAISGVAAWVRDSGIPAARIFRSHCGGWLQINATVQEAEKLLNTRYYIYQNIQTGESRAACDEYSVSTSIQHHIDFIMPTIQFELQVQQQRRATRSIAPLKDDQSKFAKAASSAVSSKSTVTTCAQQTTPDCVRALYNIPAGDASNSNNSLGLVEFAWGAYFQDDLNSFFQLFMPEALGKEPVFESIDGGFLQNFSKQFAFNGEVSLDLEYSMALVYPQNVTLYSVGDLWMQGDMNNFLAALDASYCGALDSTYDPIYPDPIISPIPGWPGGYNSSDCGNHSPTKVISVSFAWREAAYSPAYLQRQCFEYLKLGLQGVTVMFSSGDYGVAGQDGVCLDPNNGNITNETVGLFNPSFPSTCPWVTSVGGTQLPINGTVTDNEVAIYHRFPNTTLAQVVTSGGGFSNVFRRPGYQSYHIDQYFSRQKSHLHNVSQLFNSSGFARGYPDVSANAANYIIAVDQLLYGAYGTSCSTPVLASIITKINDRRLSAGKKSVGFLNPVFYENEWAFNDVVEGFNYGCDVEAFHADIGWDPVTGLGTPNFEKLLKLYMALP